KQLQQQLVQFRNERDWQQFHNPKDLSLSLTLEAAEVLEHFQWKNGDEIEDHIQANKDDIGEELADVLWYLMLLADGMNIDLGHVLEQKLDKNQRRYSVDKAKGNHKKYTELED